MRCLIGSSRIGYILLPLPMAMIGIPIYMHIPSMFSEAYAVNLALLGTILFATRLLDTISDPLLGALADILLRRQISRITQMALVLPFFLAALWALVSTPLLAPWLWLTVCLVVLYVSLSALVVNYYALGAEIALGNDAQRQISTRREAVMIAGIFLGTLLPALLMQRYGAIDGMWWMGVGVIALALVLMPWCMVQISGQVDQKATPGQNSLMWSLRSIIKNPDLIRFFACYSLNALANAIPATLIFFYTADVLSLSAIEQGIMLAVYFLSAMVAMPLWNRLAASSGAVVCWRYSVMMAALAFIPAAFLGHGDIALFAVVCVFTGAALGADMAMPASLLGVFIQRHSLAAAGTFGIYNLLGKLALALAAGIMLPVLDGLGYRPSEQDDQAVTSLAYAYALVPSCIKCIAALSISGLKNQSVKGGVS